jgi:hypothetical protein
MKRRSFIKATASAGLLTLITPRSILHAMPSAGNTTLESHFLNPPASARSQTWWHWMNGNITKSGITLDLEAMKDAGLGGFQLFNAGTGIVKGPVEYLSAEWLDLMKHAINEATRLNLEFAMHNCPGWSSSGGPWITPEMSMQQLTWTETVIKGGKKISVKLAKPVSHLNYYKDAKVIAFPSQIDEQYNFGQIIKSVTTPSGLNSGNLFNDTVQVAIIEPGINNEAGYIVLELKKTVPLNSITVFTGIIEGGGNFTIELSMNGKTFTEAANFTGGSSNYYQEGAMPATANFPAAEARYIRLKSSAKRAIASVTITGSGRNTDWLYKGNYRNSGWKRENNPLPNNVNAIDPASVLDLTELIDADGALKWNAPKGSWTVLRIGHTSIGKLNHSAPTTGTGLECDKYSKEAYNFHFSHMFNDLLPSLKDMAVKGKVGLLIDSYEMGQQNWTVTMPQEFRAHRGYDLINYLPALTGRVVKDIETTDRFLYDFRRTCADVMADNYHGEFARLCKENNFLSYTEPYGGGPYEEMQTGLRVDYNMGEFWAGNTVLWENSGMVRTLKLASSIAHATGESVVGAEAFTAEPGAGKWQQYPYSMKALGDWMYTQGLTRFIFHRFAHQPHPTAAPGMTMGPWGIHFDRTNTWWKQSKAWLDYTARSQFLLQQGHLVADLAYLTSEEPGNSIPTMPKQLSHQPPYGYDFDLIAPETLLKSDVKNGFLHTPGGMRYKVLVLPEEEFMTLKTLNKLALFAEQGLAVIGKKPIRMPGIASKKDENLFNTIVADLWSKNGDTKIKNIQSDNIAGSKPMAMMLKSMGIAEDFTFTSESGDAPINYIHRRDGENDIYFIANRRRTTEKLVCSFRIHGRQPEYWDPDNGNFFSISVFISNNNRTNVPLILPPAGSAFIVFRKAIKGIPVTSVSIMGKEVLSAKHFPSAAVGKYLNVYNNFCVGLWIKPETDIAIEKDQYFGAAKTDNYAIYPASGAILYGGGHATFGLTVGRNGIVVYEREDHEIIDVLALSIHVSGWVHVAVAYKDGAPSLLLNGKLMKEAPALGKKVHPAIGDSFQEDGASYYNGDMSKPELLDVPFNMDDEKIINSKTTFTSSTLITCNTFPKDNTLVFNQDGEYIIQKTTSDTNTLNVSGTGRLMKLSNDWQVTFPHGLGAPDKISLPALKSLHLNTIDGVKYFSGTAIYSKNFSFTNKLSKTSNRIMLDLGKIEVIAHVTLNDKDLGILWKPPYRLDITDFLRSGENKLSISVTNLWPNRLIGDEQLTPENDYEIVPWPGKFRILAEGAIKQLPQWYLDGKPKPGGGRIAFSTWKHYTSDSPLLESGLIGPVTLHSVYLHTTS